MTDPELKRTAGRVMAALGLVLLLLALSPGLDIAVSGLFHHTTKGFVLATVPGMGVLRYTLWACSLMLVVLALAAFLLAGIRQARVLGLPDRVWAFVFLLYLLGPGLIVNQWLKANWGRARPANVTEFGGAQDFTPFWQVADQCQSNCSFVSGEGSAAMALGISLFVLMRAAGDRLPTLLQRFGLQLCVILPVLGGLQRLVTGRHFLSDTLMAMVIVAALALVLHALLLRRPRED